MSKDYLAINAGRVVFTKFDPDTGALSIKPEDKRICTEACDGITRSKALNTYEIPDGNSNYPAGIYDMGMTYTIGINFTTLNTATLAFLQGSAITKGAGKIKEIASLVIPMEAPYEIDLLGTVDGVPTVLDAEGTAFTATSTTGSPAIKEFEVVAGTPDKITFNADDAGKPIMVEYVFEAVEVESYDIDENGTHPAVQVEIIHETMSVDKTKKYKNNSIINKMTLSGNIDENLARQHAPTTLTFNAIKPLGSKVVRNKKTEIPL